MNRRTTTSIAVRIRKYSSKTLLPLSSYSYFTDYRPLPVLEFGCHIFQELPDGKMLRADLLALAAL